MFAAYHRVNDKGKSQTKHTNKEVQRIILLSVAIIKSVECIEMKLQSQPYPLLGTIKFDYTTLHFFLSCTSINGQMLWCKSTVQSNWLIENLRCYHLTVENDNKRMILTHTHSVIRDKHRIDWMAFVVKHSQKHCFNLMRFNSTNFVNKIHESMCAKWFLFISYQSEKTSIVSRLALFEVIES